MIEGRTVSTIYGVYAPVKFIHEHTNDIRMSPGFCALGNKPFLKHGMQMMGIYFASEIEAEMFATKYPKDTWVGNGEIRPIEVSNVGVMAVFADWYSNDEWREWWLKKPDPKLDTVRITLEDFMKINDIFVEAVKDRKVSINQLLKELPLTKFQATLEGYTLYEFNYDGKDLHFTQFFENEINKNDKIGSFACLDLQESEEAYMCISFDGGATMINPVMKEKQEDKDKYDNLPSFGAWAFLCINWFIKTLPARVTTTTSKYRPKVSAKKKKGKQSPHKVYLITHYDINVKYMSKSSIKHEIRCACWGVRGHERHYKDGKVIFIKPYRKGKERHNPNAYVAKSYEMPKEDNDGSTETADAE